MGLRLVNQDERLTYEGEGYTIIYRRIPTATRGRIMEKNRKPRTNEIDFSKASIEMLEFCIQGWTGIYTQDAEGNRQDVVFETSKIRLIPDDVMAELVTLIGENADREDVEAGNLPTTSASSTTTPATLVDSAD